MSIRVLARLLSAFVTIILATTIGLAQPGQIGAPGGIATAQPWEFAYNTTFDAKNPAGSSLTHTFNGLVNFNGAVSGTGGPLVSSLSAGTGISVTNPTGIGSASVTNAGVTSLSAGTGISLSGSTGSVTVTNTITSTIPTFTLKKGSGVGNYTDTSGTHVCGTYVDIDATNLAVHGHSAEWTKGDNRC